MNKKSSFEEMLRRKLTELATPNEDEAWQKMKQLLDDKKKRRALFLLNNYKVVGGVLLLLLVVFSFVFFQMETSVTKSNKITQIKNGAKPNTTYPTLHNVEGESKQLQPSGSENGAKQKRANDSLQQVKAKELKEATASVSFYGKNKSIQIKNQANEIKRNETIENKNVVNTNMGKNKLDKNKWKELDDLKASNSKALKDINDSVNHHQNEIVEASRNNQSANNTSVSAGDSNAVSTIIQKESLQKTIHPDSGKIAAKTNIIVQKHNPFFINGGIQLQQQIPLGAQKLTAYNYTGNKNVLLDYVPSLYIRLEKKEQWFLQGEFGYASPRNVTEFIYSQHTQTDYTHSTVATTAYHLQKVFYSQLPISFHYYIQPHWSVGAGIAYNWFRGAVVQKTTALHDVQSGMQILSQQEIRIKNFTDSFLYKTGTSLLLQTNYTRNRWSVGLRYWQDVEPFIRYTLPDGKIDNKRSSSLQLLVSYRLFRSSSFRLKKKK